MDDKEALRVGAAVRRRRRSLGLTLAAVATRSGLSVPFLSQIENERARPSARSLDRVADALETTTARLRAAADSARTVERGPGGRGRRGTPSGARAASAQRAGVHRRTWISGGSSSTATTR